MNGTSAAQDPFLIPVLVVGSFFIVAVFVMIFFVTHNSFVAIPVELPQTGLHIGVVSSATASSKNNLFNSFVLYNDRIEHTSFGKKVFSYSDVEFVFNANTLDKTVNKAISYNGSILPNSVLFKMKDSQSNFVIVFRNTKQAREVVRFLGSKGIKESDSL